MAVVAIVVVTLAVMALMVGVLFSGVAVFWRISDSGPSTATPDQDALLRSAAVPASVRADCQGTTRLPPGATDGLVCTPGQGADRVRFYRFSSDAALTDYFDEQVSEAGVDTDAEGDCSEVVDVEHAYATVRDLEGRVLCYRAGGRSTLVWTMPEALAVGVAERFDTDDQSLYDWWNLAYQVQLSSANRRVELTVAEIELLRRIPPEVQPTCGPEDEADVLRGAVASLVCVVADTDVFYTAFGSLAAMSEVYDEQIALAGIAAGSGGVTGSSCPGEGPYRVGTPNAGNMLCSLGDSLASASWTDGLALVLPDSRPASLPDSQWWILTEAIRLDDRFGPLMELVETLGPT